MRYSIIFVMGCIACCRGILVSASTDALHVDGGVELTDQRVESFLLKEFGIKVTWSSNDTSELNAVSERKFRTLEEVTLAMLA